MARHPSSKNARSSRSSSKPRPSGSVRLGKSRKKDVPRIAILTLFPQFIAQALQFSLMGKALEKGALAVDIHDIRDFSEAPHHTVDDKPYGGGAGMLLRADVLYKAWKKAVGRRMRSEVRTAFLSPQGKVWSQPETREKAGWVQDGRLWILVCGHYEGVDERFIELCVDEEVSIGDYVLTGGELPALVLVDTLARHLPGVVKESASVEDDSLSGGLLKYPQYTRPALFEGRSVPEVLTSGNHAKIASWRAAERAARTRSKRPDLYARLQKPGRDSK